jgi:arginyl-tRNA synthetase
MTVYDRLNVTLSTEDFTGESFYNDMLAPVADELDQAGLLHNSDGAACVFRPASPAATGSRCH